MALTLVTGPTEYAVSLQEAKDHCRVDGETDDPILESLIIAATAHVENITGRKLITQTWDWSLDCFDDCELARVPFPPLSSVTSITYLDEDNASQTLATSVYQVAKRDTGLWSIALKTDQTWPTTYDALNAVTVRLVVGYGTRENVPRPIVQAMLLFLGHFYANREAVTASGMADLPMAVDALLASERVYSFG